MAKRKGKRYDEEFQRKAVNLWIQSGKPATEIAKDLGISGFSLSRWKDKYLAEEGPERDALKAENERMRKEIAELKQEREILKKSVGIFSKTQK
jgi:transposase